MNKKHKSFLSAIFIMASATASYGQALPVGGAAENTPSYSEYFSWINNTNEGPTEKQTLINLDFFKWMHDTYGMQLDIYAFDAGALDGAKRYGSTRSERFRRQFPGGLDASAAKRRPSARASGCGAVLTGSATHRRKPTNAWT